MKVHALAIVLLLFASCSPPEAASTRLPPTLSQPTATLPPGPTPTSPFLVPVDDFPGVVSGLVREGNGYVLRSQEMCIYLRQEALWEPGDYWNGFDSLPPVTITVDGIPLTQVRRYLSGPLRIEVHEDGTVIGTHGDSMDYCFTPRRIAGLEAGSHTIALVVVSTSGVRHQHTWDFTIP